MSCPTVLSRIVNSPISEVFLQNYASSPRQLMTRKPKIAVSCLFPQAQIVTTLCKTMLPHICKTMVLMTGLKPLRLICLIATAFPACWRSAAR